MGWRKAWLAGEVLVEMGLNRVQETARWAATCWSESSRGWRACCGPARWSRWTRRCRQRLGGAWAIPASGRMPGICPTNRCSASSRCRPGHSKWEATCDETVGPRTGRRPAELLLPPFYIARYPVTVAQFQAFVDNSGRQSADPNSLRGLSNHPVVRVTCMRPGLLRLVDGTAADLDGNARAPGEPAADRGWRITLSSEAQWEKAARGPDGRIFPWGDTPDSNRANYGDTVLRSTSAVGSFPDGASPYGCEDMSGNVWEWTRGLWGRIGGSPIGYPYDPSDGRENLDAGREVLRVLRGGSFPCGKYFVRCAARFRHDPLEPGPGRRVSGVCVPITSAL